MDTKDKKDGDSGNLPPYRSDASSSPAKATVAPLIWVLTCLAFIFALWMQQRKHVEKAKQWDQTVASYSNHVVSLDDKLAQQVLVNSTLESNLADTRIKASNDLAAIEATLSTTSSSLEKSQADMRVAEAAMAEQDKKIAALEGQNTELDKESNDLRGSITNLEAQIQATQKKLDASEGDKNMLLGELARLQAQKDDLEKKLSDLAFLKEQVRTLREDLSIARRLDWIRRGIYDAIAQKGGEHIIHPLLAGSPADNNTLDVELKNNPSTSTNAPAAK